MRHSGTALLALLLFMAPVQAADLGWAGNSSPIYSPTSATQWSGFYAGINGGFAWGTTVNSPALPGGTLDNNAAGWGVGAQAGYNFDMGGLVLGGETDLQWSSIGYQEDIAGGTFEAKTDLFGTLRARAGVPVGQVMPYATVGIAYGRGVAQESTGVVTSQTANHFGWTAGLGLEAQATANVSIKAEYLYVDLGGQPYGGLPVGNRDITQRFSMVRAGVNYKF
ncbi:porin family protein [Devosia sp. XJ19-1]|uniref:Porin family protein n=1 Tax=Devosia ureilytica TaxID=2952754 RepID=A0A9Q4FU52_9HYPH|nr:outer membrane protein [Devosia ureilytica]MCP8884663.1 porin family protein [Devosia ureilytica]MCP8888294.1 porin family protein [Devosia ureilytica]